MTVTVSERTFKNTLIEDVRAYGIKVANDTPLRTLAKHVLHLLVFSPGFSCVFWYRINRMLSQRGWERSAKFLHARRFYKFANDISYRAEIGPGLKVCHPSDIVIGANAKIGSYCKIFSGVTVGTKGEHESDIKPTIGNRVYMGVGSKILGGITIGDGAIIGALTFCDKSVPENAVAYGNPMVIKEK
ncbi:MAG: serine acetyltransferase [Candidatus Vogelbacteria bacterium CG10_big_fil_rev_8_21_14_0_10_49_38]|uniref:Serine acetyltransferase n=1 Tax=Candidatus Vogelbacteria bacterium CG10_big_fil_rev_8_21_14_0_10_49_38 TaxID=1975043 RepID=A0A2H0RHF0_9BACT|nr:MAG: hypothetical protein BK006_02465 [bacterium CG10_49_38]PIR45923.1 MAG: serine acetyltransferase [Candidatus Vogelbacteria bacterium CG10_big_fil_rev_8_21_14_0_10_49_38]